MSEFRTAIAENVFNAKYAMYEGETWANRCQLVVSDVCGDMGKGLHPLMSKEEMNYLEYAMTNFWFMPGGRYIYYAGRPLHYWNNCFLLKGEEDSREEWGRLVHRAVSCLMSGGGIGVDYSVFREEGAVLSRTGGVATGPIALMKIINEAGRYIKQGGSRRSAIYGSLNWEHPDARKFLISKDWHNRKIPGTNVSYWDVKFAGNSGFNFPAPLDMTNISLNYDDEFLDQINNSLPQIFLDNCLQAMMTGEPGFSFNFGDKQNETLRNACTEVTSEDDSDVCNLGSINIGAIPSLEEFKSVVRVASKFLVCGTLRADLPYKKVSKVREKNRRLGLGLMGIHEWLLRQGQKYEVTDELRQWLTSYEYESEKAANEHCDRFYINRPVAYRAIAPTGTIGLVAGTTTSIEPLFAAAYKRRYLSGADKWKYEFVIDGTTDHMIKEYGVNPDELETALTLAEDPERRIKFQANIQEYVDMGISSTINLPAWGTRLNNEDKVEDFAKILARYAPRLRGFTCYPDGSRGGQPLTPVSYADALKHKNMVFEEHDVCELTGGGTCGL